MSTSLGASALTKSKTIYSEGVGSVMPGVYTTAFPYWHALGVSSETSEEELVRLAVYQLELVLKQQTAPNDTGELYLVVPRARVYFRRVEC